MFPGLDLYHAHPAQPLTTSREQLDNLDYDLSARRVQPWKPNLDANLEIETWKLSLKATSAMLESQA